MPAKRDDKSTPTSGPYRRPRVPSGAVSALRTLRRLRRPYPRLNRYQPEPSLNVEHHAVTRARFPAVDFHTHLGRWLTRDGSWMAPDVGEVLELMDACNIATLVNLDGRWGAELEENLDRYDRAHPGRFVTFCHVDWRILQDGGATSELVTSLERSAAAGAGGLKVWKDLGLRVTRGGEFLLPDDPLLSPVWEAAATLELPVLIHVADPLAFFRPVDAHNERLEELRRHPRTSLRRFGVEHYFRLTAALEAVVARNPKTTFVGAHAGCFPEDLAWVGNMFDRYPNFSIDVAAQAAELGRRPRAAARLIEAHPDRVLFGTDVFPLSLADYRVYFRLLETDDEYFSYSSSPVPPNGRWTISGLDLSDGTLGRVYATNARALLAASPSPGLHGP
jgi:predicted TIM-barrel fold metal-dependent hydrolase